MSKLSFLIALLALFISVLSFCFFKESSHLVYVDVNKLLEGYEGAVFARADFEKKETAMRANVDSLLSNWQQELKEYEKERASMSAKELKLKQELLSNKQQQINSYQQATQKQLQEEDQKATQTVINDINDFVKSYGKDHGHRIILGATGSGTIMYADEGADLTDEILEKLNASFNGE